MIRNLLIVVLLTLVATISNSAPVGFGGVGGFGGTVTPPEELLGIRLGAGPPDSIVLSITEYIQVPLGAVEFLDTSVVFEVSSDGNLICNTSGSDINGAKLGLSASVANVGLQTWSLNVRFGACSNCIGDTFPQMDETNDFADIDMPISFRNQVLFDDAVLIAPLVVIPDDTCLGLLMLGDATNAVRVTGGTLSIYGRSTNEITQAQAESQILARVESSRGIFGYIFSGAASSVTANPTTWTQIELGATVSNESGSGASLSADKHLLCNTGVEGVSVIVESRVMISQNLVGTRDLLLRFGRRSGEGTLSDGDELLIFESTKGYMAPGVSENMTLGGIFEMAAGDCIGLMVKRGDDLGGPDRDYVIDGGGFSFFTRRNL